AKMATSSAIASRRARTAESPDLKLRQFQRGTGRAENSRSCSIKTGKFTRQTKTAGWPRWMIPSSHRKIPAHHSESSNNTREFFRHAVPAFRRKFSTLAVCSAELREQPANG